MRALLVVPVLVASLACGKAALTRREAEADIRKDYPVVVAITVPETASAIKGSKEHAALVALQEQMGKKGWFDVTRSPEGDREQFAFHLSPAAPKAIRLGAKGFQVPAAEAEFVRAINLESRPGGARVTYQIRLIRPTAFFSVFEALHPGVHIGETKDRHAAYAREGRGWILQETDETFHKAE